MINLNQTHHQELLDIEGVLRTHGEVESCVVVASPESSFFLFYKLVQNVEFVPSLGEHDIYDVFIYNSMASDDMRVKGYREALADKVKDKVVLDPGTGTELILARHCIHAGAKKVYAVEALEHAYKQAREKVTALGLEDKITLILGDARHVTLPEKIDYIVSALAGNIASSDGCIPLINELKGNFGRDVKFIPNRYLTQVAAVELPATIYEKGLSPMSAYYISEVHKKYGHTFDVRMCLRYFSSSLLISDTGTVEDIAYESTLCESAEQQTTLSFVRDGMIHGVVFWLNAYTDAFMMIDSLQHTHHLPVYFPLFENGMEVKKGDHLCLTFSRSTGRDGYHPDYHVKGWVEFENGERLNFEHDSGHQGPLTTDNRKQGTPLKTYEYITEKTLKDYVKSKLPGNTASYKMIRVEQWPLNANGEIDKQQLLRHVRVDKR
ncbi:class I SAM-dependent methyltransferase [Chitinophaga varians]|uniref:class I SAM-dependent methyltransferase n=1 Tax=Chitinophaga varians TaxID=2202339 RepID=UPI00165ED410|nr:class I SAM-dependent methyltransferase [Chitinophaga varians]MBC9915631.1 hypothetical protein [Chitinophaga varians]